MVLLLLGNGNLHQKEGGQNFSPRHSWEN